MKLILILITAISLAGCASNGVSRSGLQDYEASPCACFEYEIFNGEIYQIQKEQA